MIDKKISETIDQLIKKIKDNDLGSIKLSNKTHAIEISNNFINSNHTEILLILEIQKIKISMMKKS